MTTPGKTADQFRELHDKSYIIPKRINDGLVQLGDSWEYEGEFVKRVQVATQELAKYRDQFADFHFEVRTTNKNTKRVWCGTKKFAAKLREQAAA